MDIYEFFNSRDIGEHCQRLGRGFTGWEKAYMIWQSNHHTLRQKQAAWETLMEEGVEEALRDFLRAYIHRQQRFIRDFQQPEENYVYTYETGGRESNLFARYQVCVDCVKMLAEENQLRQRFRIRKRKIYREKCSVSQDPVLYVNEEGEPMELIVAPYYGEEDLLVPPFGFYGMYVALPVPFRKGDVVTGIDLWAQRTGPMVIDALPGGGEDYIDMCAILREGDRLEENCSYLSLQWP